VAAAEERGQKKPEGQRRHAEDDMAPTVVLKVPSGQGKQSEEEEEPANALYVPAAQD
jgi:hypothetical protein